MTEAGDFKYWIIQPGNHRLVQNLKHTLKQIGINANRIDRWQDLFCLFEKTANTRIDVLTSFEPIFQQVQPKIEIGATEAQVKLYRGVFFKDSDNVEQPQARDIVIHYRGQVLHKHIGVNTKPEQTTSQVKNKRMYRGVEIKAN